MTGDAFSMPPHAYVPGQTARHPVGAFDALRASVVPRMTEADLAATVAMLAGRAYREAGYFWEAHELLEPVWMACPPNSEARSLVQGLIQLANAQLKVRMGKPRAAQRLYLIALDHLEAVTRPVVLGCDAGALRAEVSALKTT